MEIKKNGDKKIIELIKKIFELELRNNNNKSELKIIMKKKLKILLIQWKKEKK